MINILSNETIQKIAAGEVVERPASIVKELVENSIDANSKHINVEIIKSGKTYIKVSDDGDGILQEDVEKAFLRHATSKISNFNDLYEIYSMGFRGEALSSIISVSRVQMKTKSKEEKIGSLIEYENSAIKNKTNIAMTNGTTIEVFDLFNNVPVRYKFLSSDITESNKITEILFKFAIAYPNISFKYIKDNREVFSTNSNNSIEKNYEILFGKDFMNNYFTINEKSNNFTVNGYFSNTNYYKGNRSMQYIYVNNRFIDNINITQSIEKAYNNLIPQGRFPVFEVHIYVNPNLIDVNIHPNKQKIKLSYEDELYDLLNKSLINKLYQNDYSKKVEFKDVKNEKISFYDLNQGEGYKKVLDAYKTPILFDNDILYKAEAENSLSNYIIEEENDNEDNFLSNLNQPSDQKEVNINTTSNFDENSFEINEHKVDKKETIESINKTKQYSYLENELIFKAVIFNKYLMFEDIENKQIVLIDIFRANERLLFDEIINNENIVSQELIEPIILELNKMEIEIFNQNIEIFNNIGYEVELFDEQSIIIRKVPYYFNNPSNTKNFKDILDKIGINKSLELDSKKIINLSIHFASFKNRNLNEEQAYLLMNSINKSSNPNTTESGNKIRYIIDEQDFIKFIKN